MPNHEYSFIKSQVYPFITVRYYATSDHHKPCLTNMAQQVIAQTMLHASPGIVCFLKFQLGASDTEIVTLIQLPCCMLQIVQNRRVSDFCF